MASGSDNDNRHGQQQDVRRTAEDIPPGDDMMSAERASAYENKVRNISIAIFVAAVIGGAWLFNLGRSSWEPQPQESMFVPRGGESAQKSYAPPPAQHFQSTFQAEEGGTPAVYDPLVVAHPRNPYDLPVFEADAPHDSLRMTVGEVKKIAPRNDKMSDGSTRQNLYARTEFYQPESRGVCFFYQYMGTVPTYNVGARVRVQYDTRVKDVCGSSRIVK